MIVTQTRNFVGCWRKRLSIGDAAVGSSSLTGLRVIGRFDAVVIFVSAATTAVQLFRTGDTSPIISAGCGGGATDGGIESAREAIR